MNNRRKPRREDELDALMRALHSGSSDKAIYGQEKAGQESFVRSTTLPTDITGKEHLVAAGVEFLGPVEDDELFQYVKFPLGWKLEPTDHSMWSRLVDEKGRERASIFYKAAFYDRQAFARAKDVSQAIREEFEEMLKEAYKYCSQVQNSKQNNLHEEVLKYCSQRKEKKSNKNPQERSLAIAKMPDGSYHPGTLVALGKLISMYGETVLDIVEKKNFTFMDIWRIYKDECNEDIVCMYEKLKKDTTPLNGKSDLRHSLMEIAELIARHSDGRAVLAFQEDDKTPEKVEEAAHFIKVDGKRLGRDIELYAFMGNTVLGWERTLADFLGEVLIPLKAHGLTQSYKIASEKLRLLGHEVYQDDVLADWDDIFLEEEIQSESPKVDGDKPLAVNWEDAQKWGCPYCGYRSSYSRMSGGGTTVAVCGDCGRSFAVLATGVTKSAIGFGDFYPELQEHPRKGISAHGNPDRRPEGGGEFFRSRGIGLDDCTCFICGTHDRDGMGHSMLHNIAAFVETKEAGERVLAMFPRGARLDYREYEPDRVQVKIGACDKHRTNLERLHKLTDKGVITEDMIEEARQHIDPHN